MDAVPGGARVIQTDQSREAIQALRDVLATATKLRDSWSARLEKAGGGTVELRGKETEASVATAVVDALDAVLDSEAGLRARRVLERAEALR